METQFEEKLLSKDVGKTEVSHKSHRTSFLPSFRRFITAFVCCGVAFFPTIYLIDKNMEPHLTWLETDIEGLNDKRQVFELVNPEPFAIHIPENTEIITYYETCTNGYNAEHCHKVLTERMYTVGKTKVGKRSRSRFEAFQMSWNLTDYFDDMVLGTLWNNDDNNVDNADNNNNNKFGGCSVRLSIRYSIQLSQYNRWDTNKYIFCMYD